MSGKGDRLTMKARYTGICILRDCAKITCSLLASSAHCPLHLLDEKYAAIPRLTDEVVKLFLRDNLARSDCSCIKDCHMGQ